MLTVHGVPLSPFVRKLLLTLEYKGLSYENIPVFPADESPEFRAISPLGKVPVLDHDGFTVADTSVSCRYIDRLFPDKPIYPSDPVLEAKACWLEEFADTKLIENCAGLFRERFLNPKFFKQDPDEAIVQGILDNGMPESLNYLETQIPENGYLVGDTLTIADIAVVTCFIQARYGDFDVQGDDHPKLRAYLDKALNSPIVTARVAKELDGLPF